MSEGPTKMRRGRWWKITLAAIVGLIIIAIAGGGLFFKAAMARPHPQTAGTISVPGLDHDVEVIRDAFGIPHIYAANATDLMFAQGYIHAQDRFWQMDFWRHIGSGRLSEMFGDSQLDTDEFLRTLGWAELAQRQYDQSGPSAQRLLDAYAAGVNAYVADKAPGDLGFEYTVLGVTVNRSYQIEPWTPRDTLTWGKVMAWDLGGNFRAEIQRALALNVLPPDRVDQLWPPYPGDRHPYIVPGDEIGDTMTAALTHMPGVRRALQRVAESGATVDSLTGGGFGGIGSNSWALSGDRTTTGAPLLANDPHLGIQMPSIWYQNSLHCTPVTETCPYEVTGFSFAGVPGVIIGHNADVAWGFTNLGPDVMDLFIEKVNPDNPNQYEFAGEWIDMDVRTETIEVAGGDPVDIDVRTTMHGPIISGRFEALDDFGELAGVDVPESYAIALRWTALDDNPGIFDFIDGLDTASNWDEFRAAAALFDVPSQNLLYADTAGNIGYQSPGAIPVRASGDGRLPVPGWTGEHEWVDRVPFEELPSILNPESGYIVTANNAVVDDTYPYLLTMDWNYGYRAQRIVDRIEGAPGPLSAEDLGAIQLDGYDLSAERLRPFVLAAAPQSEAAEVLAGWDLQSAADSAGAAVWNATWRRILELTFHDELPEDLWPEGGGRWFTVVADLAERPGDPFWDDVTTDVIEQRDDILATAFAAAVDDLEREFGPTAWRWGDLHTATFENATLGQSGIGLIEDRFNRGAFPSSGGDDIVNATGWTATEGFHVDWVPSFRMRVDLGDLTRSRAIHTTGQSGHTGHPHYDDMIPLWLAGETYPMLWSRDQVDAAGVDVLVLTPAP